MYDIHCIYRESIAKNIAVSPRSLFQLIFSPIVHVTFILVYKIHRYITAWVCNKTFVPTEWTLIRSEALTVFTFSCCFYPEMQIGKYLGLLPVSSLSSGCCGRNVCVGAVFDYQVSLGMYVCVCDSVATCSFNEPQWWLSSGPVYWLLACCPHTNFQQGTVCVCVYVCVFDVTSSWVFRMWKAKGWCVWCMWGGSRLPLLIRMFKLRKAKVSKFWGHHAGVPGPTLAFTLKEKMAKSLSSTSCRTNQPPWRQPWFSDIPEINSCCSQVWLLS